MSLLLPLLLACGSDEVHWAVNSLSLEPDSRGVVGTQTWAFFSENWEKNRAEKTFVCARTQQVEGRTSTELEGCEGCLAAYSLTVTEIETDCTGDEATAKGFAAALPIAVGDVPADLEELNPQGDRSLGWYLSMDGESYQPWGFAYFEELDFENGGRGLPGWTSGQVYTFSPAVALEL
ncbi:MAG TPA: hypothetical protein PKY30_00445 [Myxococcota bacterium]|nr:hypothetical protein [Myxococcota bacterium]HND29070.1 hypothetical protein [Myxococcota bacterium]HNH45473.1 hypothetical protein [Myxococcota bacterium]